MNPFQRVLMVDLGIHLAEEYNSLNFGVGIFAGSIFPGSNRIVAIIYGGTLGVNYAGMGGRIIAFNYRTIFWTEEKRRALQKDLILNHYLEQFNRETIDKKQQATCGEPCVAVCKKMNGIYKKDYEPYQTMGSLYGCKDAFLRDTDVLASRLNSGNSPIFWESERNVDYLYQFLCRKKEVDKAQDPRLAEWLEKFETDKTEAAREYLYQLLMGIEEHQREFFWSDTATRRCLSILLSH